MMDDKPTNQNSLQPEQQQLIFAIDSEVDFSSDREWYQDNMDIVVPLIIIATGLFQYALRKWLLPVSEDIIHELEAQFPSQGLMLNPKFGIVVMIIGAILFITFNFHLLL